MELEKFLINHYFRLPGSEVSNKANGWHWCHYNALAELTQHVEYGCDFTDGVCAGHRWGNYLKLPKEKQMCCCRGCLRSVGYLRYIPSDLEGMREISSYFCEETGFWRPEKGCILPRKWRSTVCLTFACRLDRNKAHPADAALLRAIRDPESAKKVGGRDCKTAGESVIELTAWIKEKKYEGDDTRRVSGSRRKRQLLEV
jgi:hypothetical protein